MTRTPDGFVATWRYTASSMWFYVALGLAGPIARAVADIVVEREAIVRNVAILAVVAGVSWFSCRPLVDAARAGLGQDAMSWAERWRYLGPALLVIPLAWIPPLFPIGIVVVPWTVLCLVVLDLPPARRNVVLLLGLPALVGLYLVLGWDSLATIDRSGTIALLWLALFLPAMMIFQMWLWGLMLSVRSRGEAEADLAAVRERLRLAADLHDVQGHHLQVIALQAELAERQVDRDPQAARESMLQVQQIARTAIAETKEIVRGYRRTSLREETVNAAAVLEAAGADVTVMCPDDLEQPLFALALREATTNVLRHSHATRVEIVATPDRLTITNDGAADESSGNGTGLASLTERVAAEGGRLTVHHEGDRFALEVTL